MAPRRDPYLDALARIAECNSSFLRVVAGPGTGKTSALMGRVRQLLSDGFDPERMLVCTFTRTAADDLRRSLLRLGTDSVSRVRAGTLHSLCFSLLARHDVIRLTGRVPRPLLDYEQRFMVQDLADAHGGKRICKDLLQAFSAAWARLQSDEPGWPKSQADSLFLRALMDWLAFHRAMLVGELVPLALGYLRDNPLAPELAGFDNVLVDEYQDLNRAEQVLLDVLATNARLTVAGDEDQSIYSFKHAHPEGITLFDDTHPGTHDEPLTECGRCPKAVVAIAQNLIEHNRTRSNRILVSKAAAIDGSVSVVQWHSMDDEAQGVAAFVCRRISEGRVGRGGVLVLAPRRQIGYAIRDALTGGGVPAHSFFHEEALEGNPSSHDESRAQEAFAALSLLANPLDRVALRCWCGFRSQSLRKGAWARLRAACDTEGIEPLAYLAELVSGTRCAVRSDELKERYLALSCEVERLRDLRGRTLVDALFPIDESWAEPLRSAALRGHTDDDDAVAVRDRIVSSIIQPELPVDVDYVRIMSLHKSKGLSANLVVVAGCIEGLIPTIKGDSDAERAACLEEQRRLFYVALTRTTDELVLSSVTRIPADLAYRMRASAGAAIGSDVWTIASTFIGELGPTCPKAIPGHDLLS